MFNFIDASHVIPENEEARLKKVKSYEILNTPPETVFDTIALLAAEIFGSSGGFVTFVDEEQVFFKSNISSLNDYQVARNKSFCSLAILQDEATVFADTHKSPELVGIIVPDPDIRFYAGAPLLSPEGYRIGTVSVTNAQPLEVTEQQLKMLKMLALVVMEKLELRLAMRKTLRAHDDRLNMMVHDLKNPMTTISLQSELIGRMPGVDEKVAMLSTKIQQQTKSIINSLNNILSAARAEHGTIKLLKTKVDLKAILENVQKNFGQVTEHKKQIISSRIDGPVEIYADSDRLQDLFENLVGNAAKYSERGKEIKISIEEAGDKVIVSIQDEGQGLLPEDLEKLFIKFARLSAIPTEHERSNGLGLSIVKMLVDLHKGRVWAESKGKNMGSTFFVELPVK